MGVQLGAWKCSSQQPKEFFATFTQKKTYFRQSDLANGNICNVFFLANGSCRFMHTATYMLMPPPHDQTTATCRTLQTQAECPNLTCRMSKSNPTKQNEAETRTKPKTSAAFPSSSCALRHCATEKSLRCISSK